MKTQLRGSELQEKIKQTILEIFEKNQTPNFKINFSELAKRVGTSRTTLYSLNEFIENYLTSIKLEKRTANGTKARVLLEIELAKKNKEIESLSDKLNALHLHHLEIYKRLFGKSIDISELIKPVLIKENHEYGRCILCNHSPLKN